MKKTIVSLILLLALSTGLRAQFSISYTAGYGTFSMGEMKDYMEFIQNGYKNNSMVFPGGLNLAIVENFPGYVTHQVETAYKLRQHEFGIKSAYMTTGGKLSQADYSGELSIELTMNGYKQELFYRYYMLDPDQKFNFYLDVAPGIIFNRYKERTKAKLAESEEQIYTAKADGINFSITPSVGVAYSLTPMFMLRASAGYDFNFPSANLDASEGGRLEYGSNWSGLRLSAGISLYFR